MRYYKSEKVPHDFYSHKAEKRRHIVLACVLAVLFGSAFWYSLTTTLDDITRRDCLAGMQKACMQLEP